MLSIAETNGCLPYCLLRSLFCYLLDLVRSVKAMINCFDSWPPPHYIIPRHMPRAAPVLLLPAHLPMMKTDRESLHIP